MAQDIVAIDAVLNLAPVVPVFDFGHSGSHRGRRWPGARCRRPAGAGSDVAHGARAGLHPRARSAGGGGGRRGHDPRWRQANAAADVGARFLVSQGPRRNSSPTPKLWRSAPCPASRPPPARPWPCSNAATRGSSFSRRESVGGVGHLRSLASPLPMLRSLSDRGHRARQSAKPTLALPNVTCVGGSWVAPADAIKARNWSQVEILAREASS